MFIILTLNHAPKNIYIRTDDPNLPVFYFDPLICVHSHQPPSLASYVFTFSHTCSFSELLVCPAALILALPVPTRFGACLLVFIPGESFSFPLTRFHARSLVFTPTSSFSCLPSRFHAHRLIFVPTDSFSRPPTCFMCALFLCLLTHSCVMWRLARVGVHRWEQRGGLSKTFVLC
jgi:hypothetical protein